MENLWTNQTRIESLTHICGGTDTCLTHILHIVVQNFTACCEDLQAFCDTCGWYDCVCRGNCRNNIFDYSHCECVRDSFNSKSGSSLHSSITNPLHVFRIIFIHCHYSLSSLFIIFPLDNIGVLNTMFWKTRSFSHCAHWIGLLWRQAAHCAFITSWREWNNNSCLPCKAFCSSVDHSYDWFFFNDSFIIEFNKRM